MAKGVRRVTVFTPEEQKQVQRAAYRVYQYIGHDLAEANGGQPMDRETVIECVCDADRLEQELRRAKLPALAEKTAKAGIDIYEVVRPAFPYAEYE